MTYNVSVISLKGLRLQVSDLARSRDFYTSAWGMEIAQEDTLRIRLVTQGAQQTVVELHAGAVPQLLGVDFEVANTGVLQSLLARASSAGCRILSPMQPSPKAEEADIHAVIEGPEGLQVRLTSGTTSVPTKLGDSSKPLALTHVVINSARLQDQVEFFMDVFGFKVSDVTARMTFLRCGADHHSIALAHGDSLSLNHAAFEMSDMDGLMSGCGRMIDHGYEIEWGPGRHGPGNNIFCYFIDPDFFAIEYTTGMDKIEDASHEVKDAQYWASFPRRPCRWGVARKPSDRLASAFAGNGAGHGR